MTAGVLALLEKETEGEEQLGTKGYSDPLSLSSFQDLLASSLCKIDYVCWY